MNRCCALPLPAVFLILFAALGSMGHTCARAQTPSWITYGGDTGVSLGWSVTTAGDVNGDGYSDIIVGCHGCDDGNQYGDWLDTGTPQGSVGSYVGFDEQIDGLTAGTDYHWKLRIAGNSPLMPRTPWMTITPSVPTRKQLRTGEGGSAVEESPDGAPSAGPRIHAIHPNPVIGRTAVRYVLPDAGPIKLQLLDVSGRLVRTIVDDTRSRGTHTAAWDGKDRDGITLSAGVYLLRLETAQGTTARKVTIAR